MAIIVVLLLQVRTAHLGTAGKPVDTPTCAANVEGVDAD